MHYLAVSACSNAKLHPAPAELQLSVFWRPKHFHLENQ